MSIEEVLPWCQGRTGTVECHAGWDALILRLHSQIVDLDPGYQVVQVKEKFGGLRFYLVLSAGVEPTTAERIFGIISLAESESMRICEVCGDPGRLNEGPWYRTRCSVHARGPSESC